MYKRLRLDGINQALAVQARMRTNRKGLRRKTPRWQHPAAIERWYRNQLSKLVDDFFEAVDDEMSRAIETAISERKTETLGMDSRLDGWADGIRSAIGRLNFFGERLADESKRLAENVAVQVSDFNREQFRGVIRATVGVDVFKSETWLAGELDSWVSENVALIKSIPGQSLSAIEQAAQRGVRSGASASDIAKEIQGRYGTTKARAKLIARDQVSKLNGDLTKKRQVALGIDTYTWSSSNDERVRPTHDEMEGRLCRWDDATVYSDDDGKTWKSRSAIGGVKLHPGEDYQCRCSASPNLEKVFEELGI